MVPISYLLQRDLILSILFFVFCSQCLFRKKEKNAGLESLIGLTKIQL